VESSVLLSDKMMEKEVKHVYLITGAHGQLGREWVDYLSGSGDDYIALGSNELDITDFQGTNVCINRYKPTVVINCAAYTKVDLAETELEFANLINHHAVENLARICSEAGIVLVHYSTDYVFEGLESDRNKYAGGYPVNADVNPTNQYGISKLAGEMAITRNSNQSLIIRTSWLCGYYGHNFVKTILKLAESKPEISVVNDQFGSPTFTTHLVLVTNALIKKRAFGIHHVSNGGIVSWFEFASEIVRKLELNCLVKPVDSLVYPSKVKRPAFSKLDCSETEKLLGISMTDWRNGLSDLLNQLKNPEKL
jgi:dTDP-4-dehydrorhamnose reductase